MSAPITFRWTGEAMVPWRRFEKTCDREYVVGQDYRMDIVQQRSAQSHNHQFVEIDDYWGHLPEILKDQFPTPEHLRKYALVRVGYRKETVFISKTKAEAQRWASNFRSYDEFCVVQVDGTLVTVWTAKSQSKWAMPNRKEFQDSKQKVLDFCAKLINVPSETLKREAGRAA